MQQAKQGIESVVMRRYEVIFSAKETPFSGRKPEDTIFGGVPFFYTIHYIGLFVKYFKEYFGIFYES